MSTVFDVPCPECGQLLQLTAVGHMQCSPCRRTYRARMGHLFLVGEPPGTHDAIPEGRPAGGRVGRPTSATP